LARIANDALPAFIVLLNQVKKHTHELPLIYVRLQRHKKDKFPSNLNERKDPANLSLNQMNYKSAAAQKTSEELLVYSSANGHQQQENLNGELSYEIAIPVKQHQDEKASDTLRRSKINQGIF
jgi:hypothetical protein